MSDLGLLLAAGTNEQQRKDRVLYHTCPVHPFEDDRPCTDSCPTLCGFDGPIVGAARCDNHAAPDDCVVCDALFEAMFR